MIDSFFEALGYRKKDREGTSEVDPGYEYAKSRYEGYLRDRQAYLKESLEISDRFDKAILALSGGSLALSLTFIEKIAPSPLDWSLWFLFVAWLLLTFSVLFGIYALAASQMAIQREIAHLDQSYREFLEAYKTGDVLTIPNSLPYGNRAVGITQSLNILSLICLGFGILLLCVFSLINLHARTVASPQVFQVQLQMPSKGMGPAFSPYDLKQQEPSLQQAKPIVTSDTSATKADNHEQQAKPAK
jgi:hypothetical protein